MGHITSKYAGGKLARMLLPMAIVVPVLLDLLEMQGEKKGLYSPQYGDALHSYAAIIILILVIWRSAAAINKSSLIAIEEIEQRKINLKEISDYKYALDESTVIAITDQKGIIKKVNSNFCKISKYSEEELIGQDHRIISSGYHSKEFIRELWVTIANGKIWKGEFKNKAKDGTDFWLDTTIVPFLNKKGKPYQYLSIRADITLKKKNEDTIKEFYRDLEIKVKERTEELAIANRKLAVSNEDLERYAYVTSHDLQEPLRMVTSFLQLLQKKYDQQLDDTAQKYINFAVDGAARMKTLIFDLLEFSRISSVEQQHTIINLNDVVAKTRQVLKAAIDESQATINVHFLPQVCGNESQLLQLFQNLIGNAIKYISNLKPVIEIGYAETPGEWQFYVQDNGIGIDKKFFEKIFIISQRLRTKKEYEGTGIGLAICKKIVELHGGKIWVESEQEKGSIFYFTISKIQMNNNTDPKDLCPGILENP